MTMWLSTFASTAIAFSVAASLGPLLGRLATQWFTGRGLTNLLTETRGAILPFVIAPLLSEMTGWVSWLVVGVVVGVGQAISVSRWIARRSGEWSPALIGGIALGRSRSALLSARAMARGAVVSTLAASVSHVILLEMLLSALQLPNIDAEGSVGASLAAQGKGGFIVLVTGAVLCIMGSEWVATWIFQRQRQPSPD